MVSLHIGVAAIIVLIAVVVHRLTENGNELREIKGELQRLNSNRW